MPILNMVGGGKKGGNIGEPLNLTVTTSGLDATITWEDNEIGTIPPTIFQKSELVRKMGSAPTSPSDGDLVETETVKDTYKTTGYIDQGLTEGETYYYRVFSYSDLGGISYGDVVSVTPSSVRERPDLDQYSLLGSAAIGVSGIHGLAISADGNKLYVGPANGAIRQYTLTGGLITGVSTVESSSSSVYTRGLYCKPDGSMLYSVSDNSRGYNIAMPTAYSLTGSSSSYVYITGIVDNDNPCGVRFLPDGDYFLTTRNNKIHKVKLNTAWDLSSYTSAGSTSVTLNEQPWIYNVAISPTGLKMFAGDGDSQKIHQYNLSTPRDITTAVYSGKSISIADRPTFSVTDSGDIFQAPADSSGIVYQYRAS